jgi:hypothetical protein
MAVMAVMDQHRLNRHYRVAYATKGATGRMIDDKSHNGTI